MPLLIYEYADSLTTLLIYECADSLMTFLIYQYVDVLTIPHAYENILLYVYCHSVHFLEYLPDCKNYFDFLYIHFLKYVFSLSFLLYHFPYYFHFYYFEYVYFPFLSCLVLLKFVVILNFVISREIAEKITKIKSMYIRLML